MAKRPQKKYAPGELDSIRSNLGYLTESEAKRMMRILGGEVGVEKSDSTIDQKYEKLKDLNRRKADKVIPPKEKFEKQKEETSEKKSSKRKKGVSVISKKLRYVDRIRLDFYAARDEFGIKSLSQAVSTLFSLFRSPPDYINPLFLESADHEVFSHIELFVMSVRSLISSDKTHVKKGILRYPFYEKLLKIAASWDIEGLHTELSRLQRYPRHQSFNDCMEFCRKIYRPLLLFSKVDPDYHLNQALKTVFDINVLHVPARSEALDRIKRNYLTAREEIFYIFHDVKKRCYPILLKNMSAKLYPFEDFFDDYYNEILTFLNIDEESIPSPPLKQLEQYSPQQEQQAGQSEVENLKDENLVAGMENGLDILKKLFPDAGWDQLDQWPDLYGYFQPLFHFPKGMVLVPPSDPVLLITVLLQILQQLFHGFRHISFGIIRDENGKAIEIQPVIDELLDQWHDYSEKVVFKQYLSLLEQYSREVDRNPSFRESQYGEKLKAEMQYIKKHFLLPKIKRSQYFGKVSYPDIEIPSLDETVADLVDILGKVVIDIDKSRSGENDTGALCEAVENPMEKCNFEVMNPVSKRMRMILVRKRVGENGTYTENRFNNSSLIMYALSILYTLEYFISDENSFLYTQAHEKLFRARPDEPLIPVYSIDLRDITFLFDPPDETVEDTDTKIYDEETGFFRSDAINERIQEKMHIYSQTKKSFSILMVCPAAKAEAEKQVVNLSLAQEIQLTIRQYFDIPFRLADDKFLILLPETGGEDSISFARRLYQNYLQNCSQALGVYIGLTVWDGVSDIDTLFAVTEKALGQAVRTSPVTLAVYNLKHHTVRLVNLKRKYQY
ncbi:MAG: hypothetical protein ACLFR1_13175 [Spirochaetia bacterium]